MMTHTPVNTGGPRPPVTPAPRSISWNRGRGRGVSPDSGAQRGPRGRDIHPGDLGRGTRTRSSPPPTVLVEDVGLDAEADRPKSPTHTDNWGWGFSEDQQDDLLGYVPPIRGEASGFAYSASWPGNKTGQEPGQQPMADLSQPGKSMGEVPGSQGGFPGPVLPPGQPQLQELEKDPQGFLAPQNPISKEESIVPDGLPFPSGQQPLLVRQNPRDQQTSGDPNPLLQHLVGGAQAAIPPEQDFMHRENLNKQAIHQELDEIRRAEAQLRKQQDLIGQQRLC